MKSLQLRQMMQHWRQELLGAHYPSCVSWSSHLHSIFYDFSLPLIKLVAERFVQYQFSSFLQLMLPTSSPLICWIFFCLLCYGLYSPVYFKTPSLLFYIISFFFCVYLLRSLVLHFLSFANSSLLLFLSPRVSTLRIESSLSKALAKEVSKGKISEVRRRTNS